MSFPSSPTNGQTTTVNGTNYVYNSANNAWKRTTTVLNFSNAGWNTANLSYNTANTSWNTANLAWSTANTVWNTANAAFTKANTAITTSGGSITGQLNVAYTPASTIGTAALITAANTQGGTGYADFLKVTNTSSNATNANKYFRLTPDGKFEIINSAYSQALAGLDNSGNFQVAGSITPTTWTAGQVIKDTMLSNSDLTQIQQGGLNRVATDAYNRDFVTYSYTPASSSSYLIVEFYLAKYDATAGTGNDSWFSQIKVNATASYSRDANGVGNGSEIIYGWQSTVNGNRSGCLFPLLGRYTNSDTNAKTIAISVRRDSADDYIVYDWTSTSVWMRITEIAR